MMMGPSRRVAVLAAITAAAAACSTGDNTVDPGDLELRDLLGISPEIASGWTTAQRASARQVLIAGLSADDEPTRGALEPVGPASGDLDDRVAKLLAAADARRGGDGADPLGVVRVAIDTRDAAIAPRLAPTTAAALDAQAIANPFVPSRSAPTATVALEAHDGRAPSRSAPTATVALGAHDGRAPSRTAPTTAAAVPRRSREPTELWLAPRWDSARGGAHLAGRGVEVLSALADDADHPGGPLVVVPSPRLAVIAAYLAPSGDGAEPRLAVNPVLLAALEPRPEELEVAAALERAAPMEPAEARSAGVPGARPPLADTTAIASTGGNPYSFYGSVGECAFAQRTRCEACLAGSTCTAITDASSGNDECMALAASSGRGYFLLCINLSLAITSVERCTGDAAASCPRDPDAAGSLTTLESNAGFLEDSTCAGALDACLAKIYGAPNDPFPGIGGGEPPADPPRSTNVSCGDACSNNNSNCTASPTCDCTGPSCNNSLSCDSTCSSSNDQSGCNGNCNACTSSGGGGGNGGGGCGGGSSSSSDGCGSSGGSGGSCGSCGSGSGGSCNKSSGSGGSCGSCGSGSGGSCNSSSGSGCGGSSCSGGGGSSKCSVATADRGPGAGVAMSLIWGFMPVPVAALTRRRAARRRAAAERPPGAAGREPAPDDHEPIPSSDDGAAEDAP